MICSPDVPQTYLPANKTVPSLEFAREARTARAPVLFNRKSDPRQFILTVTWTIHELPLIPAALPESQPTDPRLALPSLEAR